MTSIAHQIEHVPISEFCQTGSGGTPSRSKSAQYFGGTIPWVKSGELREGVITKTEESITEDGLRESSAKLLPADTLLVALYGATVGRIGVLGIEAATNQAVCHIIPDESRANRTYVFYALQSRVPFWLSKRVGGGQPNISQGIIKETKIPLPPIQEQIRIANILSKADDIRRKRLASLTVSKELSLATFRETFKDYLQISAKRTPLRNVSEVISGVAKGRKLRDAETLEVPYLRVANVQAGFLDLKEIKTIPAKESEINDLALQHGDVVMTEGGDHDKLGRGALWEHDIPNCIHQNHVFRVRVDRQKLLPTFFVHYLQTEFTRTYFLRCAKKTTNLASINMTQLRALPVPLPPLKLQEQFDQEFRKITNVVGRQTEAVGQADDLFNSLIQRAFKGEL